MPKTDKRIDAQIAAAPDFAKPILVKFREAVHQACPDCEESIKWGQPTFLHDGHILCGIAPFKGHVRAHFWKGGFVSEGADPAEWERLHRLTTVSDLPSKKTLVGWVKRAVQANNGETVVPSKKAAKPKPELPTPDYFMAALKKNKKALAAFEKFSPSHKREYVEWIVDAKGEDTRARRMAQAIEWMAEGKPRNWKYM